MACHNLIGVSHMINRLLFLLLVVALTAAVAGAQSGKIRISATAEVLVPPDVAQVVFAVTSEAPDRATAEQKAAAEVKAILDEINALQLPKLQTRPPRSQTRHQEAWPPQGSGGSMGGGLGGGRGATPRPAGYVVGTVIEVWFEGDAVALEAGVNNITAIAQTHGAGRIAPDITCRDLEPARQQALAEATRTATKRAQAMAKAAGVRISGYSYIGPCPENARQCPQMPIVFRGPTGFGSSRYAGGAWGAGGAAVSLPVIEVHNTMVSATIWVTAVY